MPVDLSIIIVNWKSAAFTRDCVLSIQRTAGNLRYEIIVIDNASYDGCQEMLATDFPQVRFIQSERNLGFAGANNIAFEHSCGRNVLFLNPDTEVGEQALQRLLKALESMPEAGMVGARLLNSDGSLQTTCVTAVPSIWNQALSSNHLRKTFPNWRTWGMHPLFTDSDVPSEVEAISGACMMAKREVVQQVAGFTKDYFMYAEDMDLCVKIVKAGWKIYYVPTTSITHHAAKSSSSREESNFSSIMIRESVLRFMQVYRGQRYARMYRASTGIMALIRLLLLLIAFPASMHPRGRRFLTRALRKWTDLFIWSVNGGSRWASQQLRISHLSSLPRPAATVDKA